MVAFDERSPLLSLNSFVPGCCLHLKKNLGIILQFS
jgi:hypothetical protein